MQQYEFRVTGKQAGERLDRLLTRLLAQEKAGISRNRIQQLQEAQMVWIDGKISQQTACKVKEGQVIEVRLPPPIPARPQAEKMPLDIIYEDESLLLLNKPAGLVVHPGAGNHHGTLVNGLLHHCGDSLQGIGGVERPGIVHRLDKDSSGLLVVAKTQTAHQGLAQLFHDHSIERRYQAMVWGRFANLTGLIDKPIARDPYHRTKYRVSQHERAKSAKTEYEVKEYFPHHHLSLVTCRLHTGRTHQIRVHMSDAGHPLLGDKLYQGKFPHHTTQLSQRASVKIDFPRQALHAYCLGFVHPVTHEPLYFEVPLALDLERLIQTLRLG